MVSVFCLCGGFMFSCGCFASVVLLCIVMVVLYTVLCPPDPSGPAELLSNVRVILTNRLSNEELLFYTAGKYQNKCDKK